MNLTLQKRIFCNLGCVSSMQICIPSLQKQKAGNGVDVLYSRAKRQCSCGQSACSCSPVTAIFQISCSCPQTCSCTQTVAPTYPPVTYTMVTTTPAPVIVTTRPTSTSYCCILYVCATGCTYGSEVSDFAFL